MHGFTEGPWIAIRPDEWTHTVVTDLHKEIPGGSPNYWAVASINGRRDEAEQNLKLVAAAPKLIDALQMLIDYADDSDGCQYGTLATDLVRSIAQEAIDLATK